MSERKLSKRFGKAWFDYCFRIEPKACSEGIPDVLCAVEDCVIFCELKYDKKFKNKKLKIRRSQIRWFLSYPGKAFFLFEIEGRYYFFDKEKTLLLSKKIEWEVFKKEAISFEILKSLCSFIKNYYYYSKLN